MLRDLVVKNRSFRRFDASHSLCEDTLERLVDLARLSPSAANKQPLKYFLSWTPEVNTLVFPCLQWAAYLKEWKGPETAERPTAYIVILGDKDVSPPPWISLSATIYCWSLLWESRKKPWSSTRRMRKQALNTGGMQRISIMCPNDG